MNDSGHFELLGWLGLSVVFFGYVLLVWIGKARKAPKLARRSTALGIGSVAFTFMPSLSEGKWIAVPLATMGLCLVGAVLLFLVPGEGEPSARELLGRSRYAFYLIGVLLALALMVAGALLAAFTTHALSLIVEAAGFFLALCTIAVTQLYLQRKHRAAGGPNMHE